ncbi:hypothetical protein ACOMHN_038583 [Nucella lapillus]
MERSTSQLKSFKMIFISAAILLFAVLPEPVTAEDEPEWDYEGNILAPSAWFTQFQFCGLNTQSPINLDRTQVLYIPQLMPFDLSQYKTITGPQSTTTLKNEGGHTAEVVYSGPEITISGGSLSQDYVLDQFHFHWGSDDAKGSEHTVDGIQSPMEMHIVHHIKGFPLAQAAQQPFGLAVLAFFFQVRSQDNVAIQPLISHFGGVTYRGKSELILPAFNLTRLLPVNAENGAYYRYEGSLTTPPCYQSVVWTVFKDPIDISSSQLAAFRALQSESVLVGGTSHPLENNFRPTQDLHYRFVVSNDASLQQSGDDD